MTTPQCHVDATLNPGDCLSRHTAAWAICLPALRPTVPGRKRRSERSQEQVSLLRLCPSFVCMSHLFFRSTVQLNDKSVTTTQSLSLSIHYRIYVVQFS